MVLNEDDERNGRYAGACTCRDRRDKLKWLCSRMKVDREAPKRCLEVG